MTYPQNPQGQPQEPQGGQHPGQYPGSQPTPAQPYPGSQPTPAQPGGQPTPGQPYPGGQPYQGQPYPGQPYAAYPGGPGVLQPKPNGATAIIAGVLAILGGIFAVIGVIGSIVVVANFTRGVGMVYVSLIVNLALTGLLFYGAIALFLHKASGRLCVIIGSGLAIAIRVVSVVIFSVGASGFEDSARIVGAGVGGTLVAMLPPIATLVLAIVKPTVDWVNYRPTAPGAPAPGGYPPAQGW
ncbi:hypothetical protein [Amycolatopsis jejuensis]|uniref:hypothetical protein n=1 Tax=Amycolatopsis jejuensis TaxID=330084 RepID=UPI0006920771|nr:hypothetical protein [Amycolatopsis jejuensis]